MGFVMQKQYREPQCYFNMPITVFWLSNAAIQNATSQTADLGQYLLFSQKCLP